MNHSYLTIVFKLSNNINQRHRFNLNQYPVACSSLYVIRMLESNIIPGFTPLWSSYIRALHDLIISVHIHRYHYYWFHHMDFRDVFTRINHSLGASCWFGDGWIINKRVWAPGPGKFHTVQNIDKAFLITHTLSVWYMKQKYNVY